MNPVCCIMKAAVGACCCTKPPNLLDEVVISSQIMLSKVLFCKDEGEKKQNDIMMGYFQHAALWRVAVAPTAAQNHQMSSMRWSKVVKSCYQNNHFAKIEKQFFRYHDGINPACCILKDCFGARGFTKPPNELDEVVKSGQIMWWKSLFYKNRNFIFFDIMMA